MTTTWRYAMTREVHSGEVVYAIREVFTSTMSDGQSRMSYTDQPVTPSGGTWVECGEDLVLMSRAVGGPILDLSDDEPEWIKPHEARKRDAALAALAEAGGES